jgi:hypothetical protein
VVDEEATTSDAALLDVMNEETVFAVFDDKVKFDATV